MLRNHKLINFLADHRLITMVSVNKTHVIATLSPKFHPDDVKPLCDRVGQWPIPKRSGDQYFIVFERFPTFENKPRVKVPGCIS